MKCYRRTDILTKCIPIIASPLHGGGLTNGCVHVICLKRWRRTSYHVKQIIRKHGWTFHEVLFILNNILLYFRCFKPWNSTQKQLLVQKISTTVIGFNIQNRILHRYSVPQHLLLSYNCSCAQTNFKFIRSIQTYNVFYICCIKRVEKNQHQKNL